MNRPSWSDGSPIGGVDISSIGPFQTRNQSNISPEKAEEEDRLLEAAIWEVLPEEEVEL